MTSFPARTPAGDPALRVKGEGVEFEALFGVARSRGVGDVVLGGFEHSTVGFQSAGGGDESCEEIRHNNYPWSEMRLPCTNGADSPVPV